jgi:hypothetical protein
MHTPWTPALEKEYRDHFEPARLLNAQKLKDLREEHSTLTRRLLYLQAHIAELEFAVKPNNLGRLTWLKQREATP